MPVNGLDHSGRGKNDESGKRLVNGGRGNAKAGSSKKAGSKQKSARETKKDVGTTKEDLEAKKVALLAEKHTQLETVVEKHDNLVREIFHMDHFINMLAYDPKEAKKDQTEVFTNYKTRLYDLVDKAVPGPSRATRRTHTERKQFLAGASTSVSNVSPPIVPKPKFKAKTTTAIWERLGGTQNKGKGKGKAEEMISEVLLGNDSGHFETSGDIAVVEQEAKPEESISVVFARRHIPRKGKMEVTIPLAASDRRIENRDKPQTNTGKSISVPTRRSGRLKGPTDGQSVEPVVTRPRQSSQENILPTKRNLDFVDTPVPPATPKFNVKRLKLVVRRPPPPLSNPKQRPPPTKYGSSLANFLASYTTHNNKDVDDKTLQREITHNATILERTEQFRKQGRFIPGTDHLFGFNVDITASYTTPQRNNKDHWDHVVEAAMSESKHWRKRPSGKQIAAQVASKIQAYWDNQEAKKDKLKSQEERRLRALAKHTIKMVTQEWKKAVFYIREQERLRLEAEEVKRGHAHLDALLDQSGQLLETQQGDLSRGDLPFSRSRSSSMHDWESVGEDEDEDEEENNGGDVSGGDDGGEEEAEEDNDDTTRMLLDDAPTRTTEYTPTPSVSSTAQDPLDTLDPVPMDDQMSDEDLEGDGSSIFAVHELITNGPFDSSPIRPSTIRVQSPVSLAGHTKDNSYIFPEDILISPGSTSLHSTHSLYEASPEESPQPSSHTSAFVEHNDDLRTPQQSSIKDHSRNTLPSTPLSEAMESSEDVNPIGLVESSEELWEGSLRDDGELSPEISELGRDTSTPRSRPPSSQLLHSLEHETPPEMDVTPPDEVATDADEIAEAQPKSKIEDEVDIEEYLKPFAVAPVHWDLSSKIVPPLLLRGSLRPYQQIGLEWLASLHMNKTNGILADEMGLGKTIQTIALLAHLACDRGIWGPHLIVVPTSVLLNWEMEFKKFLPGFKVLSYHGNTKRRKELRQGWTDKHHFNVCITSYTLASRDAHIFKRKPWYYMILDEAHMIKNFKSQRWNTLLMFRSFRRLLLTGTPLQNNLTELWALLQFLMSGAKFANLGEFNSWFSNPLEKAIEMGNIQDDETIQRVTKLHTVLRPYLLRRLKRDVEKELPSKYDHLVLCPLSKRQRFLYDEFMSRAQTRDALQSGVYQKIANILMQLRKVCNHPDLFEVRPIVTSFAMPRSAIANFEIKELLLRRLLLNTTAESVNLDLLGLRFLGKQNTSIITALSSQRLDATSLLPFISELPGEPPPKDMRTVAGFRKYSAYLERASKIAHWSHTGYLNRLRCSGIPTYSKEMIRVTTSFHQPLLPLEAIDLRSRYWDVVQPLNGAIKSYTIRAREMASLVDKFAFVTPAVVALDMPQIALPNCQGPLISQPIDFDDVLHRPSVKLQIAFPDPSLLQYDCGKLQELARLLREKKIGGHRVLIFTQMTKILDILEIFLNFHGYLYLRLDGATKIEDRQYITERFNADSRIFCFIASSRSGGVGINLTGADTVVFYDSDFNPQMDRQCEDRAHRIGQIRDVHIYRFVSQHTVEEAMLRKANQKRSLDDLVIQKGEFDWRSLFKDESALTKALGEFEDTEDAHAAAVAASEEVANELNDEVDFGGDIGDSAPMGDVMNNGSSGPTPPPVTLGSEVPIEDHEEDPEGEGGSVVEYMILAVQRDYDYFGEWRL
ncbi:SNF2 family N-terminal domain-containing protein [Collybia nuda]|uniref:DNA helicase n=1 Tax=Collybia nuda TaxID=64659 RepID=A0A9P5Y5D4_9AGAR|nr:SNF2 family N-terminal domain-containing protein [Collybia nuda]